MAIQVLAEVKIIFVEITSSALFYLLMFSSLVITLLVKSNLG